MESGRPRARRARPRDPRGARGAGHAAVALLSALCAASILSCGAGLGKVSASAFSSALASLDSAMASRRTPDLGKAFSLAFKRARESSDWLSILKRARAADASGDSGRYADAADRARKAFPSSEPIAAAAALAYMRGGRAAERPRACSVVRSPPMRGQPFGWKPSWPRAAPGPGRPRRARITAGSRKSPARLGPISARRPSRSPRGTRSPRAPG